MREKEILFIVAPRFGNLVRHPAISALSSVLLPPYPPYTEVYRSGQVNRSTFLDRAWIQSSVMVS